MVAREALFGLALSAIDDERARVVLQDALIESCPLPKWLLEGRVVLVAIDFWTYGLNTGLEDAVERLSGGDTAPMAARGIAALLLFGDWSTKMWPVVKRCQRPLVLAWYRFGDDMQPIRPPPVEAPATASADAPARPE